MVVFLHGFDNIILKIKRLFEPAISCVRDQDITKQPTRLILTPIYASVIYQIRWFQKKFFSILEKTQLWEKLRGIFSSNQKVEFSH